MSDHGMNDHAMNDHEDARVFARLRSLWREIDPMPASLIDRMIAAVAAEGLSAEYALLTLVAEPLGAVRGETDALTLQFSDGTTSILLHVTVSARSGHRIDGWVDTAAAEIVLTQGSASRTTTPSETGRFVFDDVPAGLTRVRMSTRVDGEEQVLSTPQFEL